MKKLSEVVMNEKQKAVEKLLQSVRQDTWVCIDGLFIEMLTDAECDQLNSKIHELLDCCEKLQDKVEQRVEFDEETCEYFVKD